MGISIGSMAIGPLYTLLIHLYGWRGALIIHAGIALNGMVVGAAFRPLPRPRTDPLSVTMEEPVAVEVNGSPSGTVNGLANGDVNGSAHEPANGSVNNSRHGPGPHTVNGPAPGPVNGSVNGLVHGDGSVHQPVNGTIHTTTVGQRHSVPRSSPKRKRCDLSLLQSSVFILYAAGNSLFEFGKLGTFQLIPSWSTWNGISREDVGIILTVIGISSFVGRMSTSLLSGTNCVNRTLVAALAITVAGVVLSLNGLVDDFYKTAGAAAIFSAAQGKQCRSHCWKGNMRSIVKDDWEDLQGREIFTNELYAGPVVLKQSQSSSSDGLCFQ